MRWIPAKSVVYSFMNSTQYVDVVLRSGAGYKDCKLITTYPGGKGEKTHVQPDSSTCVWFYVKDIKPCFSSRMLI